MQTQELLNLIRSEQKNLSPLQQKVAAYVLENYKKIPFLSITALAENIGVSHYTVTKFCNHMGFQKFSEFKKKLSEYTLDLIIYNKLSDSEPAEATPNNCDDFFEQGLSEDITSIQVTLSHTVNRENLPRLLDMVDSAHYIYVIGGRASGYFAGLLATFLRYLNLKVFELQSNNGDFWDRLSIIQPDDLVIAISFPRYTAQVVQGLEALHNAGVPIALITDSDLSPARAYADLTFQCDVSSNFYIHCYTGCLSLISTICHAISARRKKQAIDHIHRLEKQLLDEGIFL